MKNPFFLKAVLMAALGVSPALCQAQASQRKQPVQKTATQQAPGQQQGAMSQGAMSPQEQQFAMKLSALHRQIFMMVFTPDLRKEAMDLMTTPDDDMDDETPMTQDMAVEEVISNHRDAMTKPMPATNNQKAMPQQTKQQTQNTTKKKSYWD